MITPHFFEALLLKVSFYVPLKFAAFLVQIIGQDELNSIIQSNSDKFTT